MKQNIQLRGKAEKAEIKEDAKQKNACILLDDQELDQVSGGDGGEYGSHFTPPFDPHNPSEP